MPTAVYAGSFDPPTNGHIWMIERGLELFDHLIVAIGTNPSKRYSFTVDERLELLRASTTPSSRLEITHFDNRYLVDYAGKAGAKYVLRGIRSTHDYEYERVMRHINADMAPEIITAFLMPPRDISELSSSMIKEPDRSRRLGGNGETIRAARSVRADPRPRLRRQGGRPPDHGMTRQRPCGRQAETPAHTVSARDIDNTARSSISAIETT